jgi:hypothetical protein
MFVIYLTAGKNQAAGPVSLPPCILPCHTGFLISNLFTVQNILLFLSIFRFFTPFKNRINDNIGGKRKRRAGLANKNAGII